MNTWFQNGEEVDVIWCVGGDMARGIVTMAVPHEDRYLVTYDVGGKLYESSFRAYEMRKVP